MKPTLARLGAATVLVLGAAGIGLLAGRTLPAAFESAESRGLAWRECPFPVPYDRAVHCGVLGIGAEVEIPVVVIRRSLWRRDPKPLVFVNGGPGAATLPPAYSLESWFEWIDRLRVDRDLVLFDFLGTGGSRPAYTCDGLAPVWRRILGQPLSNQQSAEAAEPSWRECHQQLLAAGRDLSKLTLPFATLQVAALIETLPDADWDLYAISHGTRIALSLMREPPANLRRVVLDSVFPTDVDFELALPRLTHDALHALFRACALDPQCTRDFGDLEALFYDLKAALDRQPADFSVEAIPDEAPVRIAVNGHRLVHVVFTALYWWDTIEQIPAALSAAARGDTQALEPLVENYAQNELNDSLNWVVFASDGCSDRRPGHSAEALDREARAFPRLYDTFAGLSEFDTCRFWKTPPVASSNFQPVESELPTLVLAGALDPVTPPRWARRAARHLAHAQLFEIPGIGHGVVDSDDCGGELMRAFLDGDLRGNPPECLEHVSDPDFDRSGRDA